MDHRKGIFKCFRTNQGSPQGTVGEGATHEDETRDYWLSRVGLFATPWTVAYQAPPSMGFSRQEYWSGLPFPSSGDLPNPGIEPRSPALQADALTSEPPGKMKRSVTKCLLTHVF